MIKYIKGGYIVTTMGDEYKWTVSGFIKIPKIKESE